MKKLNFYCGGTAELLSSLPMTRQQRKSFRGQVRGGNIFDLERWISRNFQVEITHSSECCGAWCGFVTVPE